MRGIKILNYNVHTGNDLGLVMTAKSLDPPTTQTFVVNVPGRNGSLDFSEFLTGEPVYNNRMLKFKFLGDGSRETVLSYIDQFNAIHGLYLKIVIDDYPEYYYEGRASVKTTDNGNYCEIELEIDALPFRFKLAESYYETTDHGITIYNGGKPIIPKVTVTAETWINKGEAQYHLDAGTYEIEGLKLATGANRLDVLSAEPVKFTFRERTI